MLDHVLLGAIDALRGALDDALLVRHAVEERLQVDVLLGDVSFETAYTLPGEDTVPRVQADITVDWPTWSQTTYRAWALGDGFEDPPELDLEITFRAQRLAARPDPETVRKALPDAGPDVPGGPLEPSSPTIEEQALPEGATEWAVEVAYTGVVLLDEDHLEDKAKLVADLASVGRWAASTLVRLADLPMAWLPPLPIEDR